MSDFYLKRIQRGIDYVEAHLAAELPLHEVAQAAGLSQWHFQRIFKSITGDTLKAYIRGRRMANALELLSGSELRVVDIAVSAGFESQEAFARAFKQVFGVSPLAYRKLGKQRSLLTKLKLDADALRQLNAHVALEPEICRLPALTLVGCRTHFYGADSEKNNLGEKLPPLWAAFLARRSEIDAANSALCYGVLRQERDDTDRLEYFAAMQVNEPVQVPAGMATVHIPAATYARFEHRGRAEAVDRTVSYAYATWLMRSGRRLTYGPDLEIYDARYHPTDEASVLSYAIPVSDPSGSS